MGVNSRVNLGKTCIIRRVINGRLFSNICKDMNSIYQIVLLQVDVRWLSGGLSLFRLLKLKYEVVTSLAMQQCHFGNINIT